MPRGDLHEYDEKRDLSVTPEPGGRRRAASAGPLTFVVQKHAARRLHYDLRLEIDGVYVSWAVPKGPSLDPAEKRLAVHVEDHPLEYGTFEGVIPRGEYGAGQDIVWDNGTYAPDEDGPAEFTDRKDAQRRLRADLTAGKLGIRLRGRKLKGSWAVVKTRQDEQSWLLIKHQDDQATTARDVLALEASVLTGVSIEDLKRGVDLPGPTGLLDPNPAAAPGAKRAAIPKALRPMLANTEEPQALTRRSFTDGQWLIEPKLDGIRALAFVRDGAARLVSRNEIDLTEGYPAIAAALARQPAGALLLDGEIVAPGPSGAPSFELLQQRMNLLDEGQVSQADAEIPVIYYAFDLLHVDGIDLRGAPLWLRKEHLARAVDPSAFVRVVEPIDAPPRRVYDLAVAQGYEGVVAKRRDSKYVSNKRTAQWLKFKAERTDEFVVGGFTKGRGARAAGFGALLLGRYDADGRLVYAGRVGSGFTDAMVADLRATLDELVTDTNPFPGEPPEAKITTYVRPQLVVEVKFAEETSGGQLRAPVFLRLRRDKDAGDVTARTAASSTAGTSDEGPSIIEQLEAAGADAKLRVEGTTLAVTNLDKEMWPAYGDHPPATKRDFLLYLARMAGFLLPHLRDRPLTLTRFPNGIAGKSFYQKHWSQRLPPFVRRVAIYSEEAGGDQDYLLCNNLGTLLWLGQLADLTLHVSLARTAAGPDGAGLPDSFSGSRDAVEASILNYPDFLLFDLDPFIPEAGSTVVEKNTLTREGFERCAQASLWLKALLDGAGLRSFVKTSGSSGMHVFVPIERNLRYDVVRAVCGTIAGALVQAHPRDVTTVFDKDARTGKVYIDVNQNGRIRSLAAIYSPRAKDGAPVSMPLRWDEVGEADPLSFNLWSAPGRAHAAGDPWARILDVKQDLRSLVS